MKMGKVKVKISLLFLLAIFPLIFSASSAYTYQGWLFQNPYPTSQSLSGVKFVSPQKGWIIGMEGTILYTEDGGNTWNIQESGTNQYLTSIFFINENTGWIVGTGGVILHTEDGGKNWVLQDSGSIRYALHKVFFINSQEGWIVGNDTPKRASSGYFIKKDEGIIFHTKDSGKNWEKQSPGRWLKIASIFFIDSNTGWFLAGDKVFRTKDCGKNWEYSFLPIPESERNPLRGSIIGMPKIGGGWKGDIFFADANKGWAVVGFWYIFYTDDGGETWKAQFSGEHMSYGLGNFFFADDRKACVGGSTIFCTEDGLSWKEQLGVGPMRRKDIKGFLIELWGGDFVNNNIAWAVGPYGLIMKTEDGGKNWEVKTRVIEGILTFVNEKVGWNAKGGTIFYTDDGGDTWKVKVEMKDLIALTRFFVFNHLEGLAVGYIKPKTKEEDIYRVRILKTTDGGKTWVTQVNEAIIHSREPGGNFYFIDFNNGWFIGDKGIIFHTEDGGRHWEPQKSGTKLHLHGVCFINAKEGWVIGDSGVRGLRDEDDPMPEGIILHTDDGGNNWHIQWNKKGVWLNSVFFVDSNKGKVTGEDDLEEDNLFFYTEDGGKTWLKRKSTDEPVGISFFIDEKRGWIPIEEREFLITEDGGKTWKRQKTGLHKYPWRPFMEDEKTLQK